MRSNYLILSTLIVALGTSWCSADTVTWTGAGDGVNWSSAANWSGGVLPDEACDVVIAGGSGSVVQLTSGSQTVRSLTCSKTLVIKGADLYITGGSSSISGNFYLTNAGSISARYDGTTVSITGQGTLDGDIFAREGASISVPNIKSVTNFSYTATFRAEGPESTISLSGVTNLSAAPHSRIYLQAYDGGVVDARAVKVTANGILAYADGTDSQVNLGGLSGRMASKGSHAARLDARAGGAIMTGAITQLENVDLFLAGDSTIPTSQLTLATNSSITVDGASPSFANLRDIPDTELNVYNGGVMRLPLVTRVPTAAYTVTWEARDASSLLEFPALTTLVVHPNSRLFLEAYDGGKIDAHAVTLTTNAVQVFADELNSVVDLSGLSGRWVSKGSHANIADARDGGTVLIPKVTEMENAELRIYGGTIPTAQLKLMTNCVILLRNIALTLNNLKDIPDTEIFNSENGSLTLPAVTVVPVRSYTISWRATDPGSLIALPALTRFDIAENSRLFVEALDGAKVHLKALTQVENSLRLQSTGTGSVIDMSALTGRWSARGDHMGAVDARNGGSVLIPNVTELENVDFTVFANGQITSSQITTMTNCDIYLTDSAMPDLRALRNIPNTEIQAREGAVAQLTNVLQAEVSAYTISWEATGVGSMINLGSLRQINVGVNSRLFVSAYEGGRVDMPNLDALTTGAVQFLADGPNSTVDLRGLSSFINVGDHDGKLTARNGGRFLFNDQAFILRDVAVSLESTNPVLPQTLAASSQLTLHGKPWRSYWVERRFMSPVPTEWAFAARVPLTNTFQPFAAGTPTNIVYRVNEFVAQQPIVDPIRASDPTKFGVVLYATPQTAQQLQSTRDYSNPWSTETTVTMTNSFRIFAPSTMVHPFKFYRAKQQ